MKPDSHFYSEISALKSKTVFLCLFIIGLVSTDYCKGQDTIPAANVNKFLYLDGKQLVIKYDLPYSDTTQLFDIVLKIYYNNRVIEPNTNSLTGSWGEKIKPGVEKVILWDFPNEFTGDINKVTVEVVARKMVQPQALFEYQVLTSKPPYEVKFDNNSKNADFYSWKFGDGSSVNDNISTLVNPVHKYRSGGKYNVELTAGNSKSKTSNSISKVVSLGMKNAQELQKHKTLRTVWGGGAVLTAGIGGYSLVKSNNVFNDWKTATTDADKLKKEYKTYDAIGAASLVVSGVCISQVILQSLKIRKINQSVAMNIVPIDKGGAIVIALEF